MKQKILEGEVLEDTANKTSLPVSQELISSSVYNRVNRSVLVGPRTTKNG
jgi:hypothetical protein